MSGGVGRDIIKCGLTPVYPLRRPRRACGASSMRMGFMMGVASSAGAHCMRLYYFLETVRSGLRYHYQLYRCASAERRAQQSVPLQRGDPNLSGEQICQVCGFGEQVSNLLRGTHVDANSHTKTAQARPRADNSLNISHLGTTASDCCVLCAASMAASLLHRSPAHHRGHHASTKALISPTSAVASGLSFGSGLCPGPPCSLCVAYPASKSFEHSTGPHALVSGW